MQFQAAHSLTRVAIVPLISLFSYGSAYGSDYCGRNEDLVIDWASISSTMIEQIPFKQVKPSHLSHPVEHRGLIEVPIDYDRPDGTRLQIFYRVVPSIAGQSANRPRPYLVIMNGGPGVPSSAYRSLDFDYQGGEVDPLSHLSEHFRLVLVDQRGTGLSSPLNLDSSDLSAPVIAGLFDSDEHALDHAQVIERVIPKEAPFFILARSYGGEIGFQYLLHGDRVRKPTGMIFSSAILPHSDALESFLSRREKQHELNQQLKSNAPTAIEKLNRLRRQLEQMGLDRGNVNFLWADLGGAEGWEQKLEKKIDRLLAIDGREALKAELGGSIVQSVSLLNYILSSGALTPGYTDRTITIETSRRIPFESWMLDENWTLNQLGTDGSWRECFISAVDRHPPPPTHFPPTEVIREALSAIPALFTFGTEDAFVPGELQAQRAQRLGDPQRTDYILLQGGHGSAFSKTGAQVVADWAQNVLESHERGMKQ